MTLESSHSKNHNNGIIAVNRNYGIKKATGEYIAFCDDDDYWEKNKLEIQIRYLQNDEFIGIGSSIKLIDGNSKIIENQERKKNITLGLNEVIFQSVPLSSLIVRNIGLFFDENKLFFAVEDFDYQISLIEQSKKPILYLHNSLVYYRVGTHNKSSGLQQKINCLNILSKYKNKLAKEVSNQYAQLVNYRIAIKYLNKNNYTKARAHLTMVIRMISFKNKKILKSLLIIFIISLPQSLSERIFKRFNILD